MGQLVRKSARRYDALAVEQRRERMKILLEHHAAGGNIGLSCKAAGIGRGTLYYWLEQSADHETPNPDMSLLDESTGELIPFSVLFDEARESFVDTIEQEIHRRAVEGVDEPIVGTLGRPETIIDRNGNEKQVVQKYTGIIGYKKSYSDLLMMFYMKKLNPQFRENVKVDVEKTVTVRVESARERLADKLALAIERKRQAALPAGDDSAGSGNPANHHDAHAPEAIPVVDGVVDDVEPAAPKVNRTVTMHRKTSENAQ